MNGGHETRPFADLDLDISVADEEPSEDDGPWADKEAGVDAESGAVEEPPSSSSVGTADMT